MIDDAAKGIFASDWKFQCYFKCVLLNTKIVSKIYKNFL